MPLLAVEGAVDDIAGVGQRGGELAVEIGVVLDDEQAQVDSPLTVHVRRSDTGPTMRPS